MGRRSRRQSARRRALRACSKARCTGSGWTGSSETFGWVFPHCMPMAGDRCWLPRLFLRQLSHVSFELVVLIRDGVEKQALGEVRAALAFVHLIDQVLNLFDHVFERPLE